MSTLGAVPPASLNIETYLVAFSESLPGKITVLTTPGSACTAAVEAPGAPPLVLDTRVTVGPGGSYTWIYQRDPAARGQGTHSVTCAYQSKRIGSRAWFTAQ